MNGIDYDDVGGVPLNDSDIINNGQYYFTSPEEALDESENDDGDSDEAVKPLNTTLPFLISNTSRYIFDLNGQKAASFLPIFIVLGLIMVLSVFCNILVCYVYRCRSRRSTSNFFFIFFAIYDTVGCLIGIPAEMLDLALPYVYDIVPLCKIMGFLKTWLICGLCLTLICVAFDCYKKLCRPNEEFGVKKARIYCIIAVIAAFFFSISSLIVFGTKEVLTIYPGVYGKSCSVDPDLPRWIKILYYVCILFSFTMSLIIMTIFYCLIGVWLCKQRQAQERGEKPSPVKREFPKTHRFVKEETSTSSITNEELNRLYSPVKLTYSPKALHTDPSRVPLKTNSSSIVKGSRPPGNSPVPSNAVLPLHVKTTKQALIFMVISVIFVVFMLPFVVVTTLRVSTSFFDKFSSDETEIVFNLCVRSYLLNYIVKPIVYLICNVNFRIEVKQLFHKIWALCTSSASEQATTRQLQRSLTMGAPRSTSRTPIYRPPPNSV